MSKKTADLFVLDQPEPFRKTVRKAAHYHRMYLRDKGHNHLKNLKTLLFYGIYRKSQ
jgi:hypothetical protein